MRRPDVGPSRPPADQQAGARPPGANTEALHGLAAELAQQAGMQGAGTSGLQGLPPMRPRTNGAGAGPQQPPVQEPPAPPPPAPQAPRPRPAQPPLGTGPAFGIDAELLSNPQAALQAQAPARTGAGARPQGSNIPLRGVPPPNEADNTEPYGLLLELTQNGGGPLNPLAMQNVPTARRPQGAAQRQQAGARRGLGQQMDSLRQPSAQQGFGPMGAPPGAVGDDASGFPPVLGPGEGGPTAVPYEGLPILGAPEPDYGLVAELRGETVQEPFAQRHDFGLAAEVARRRARGEGTGAPVRTSMGGALAARPRKRLAAAGPADFGLAQEMAERAAALERARLDPFSSANRASNADPFLMAGDMLKFPTVPFVPGEPQDQEIPEGPVPLKVPASGASFTSNVSQDDGEYGLADELGVDPEEARRRRLAAMDAASRLEAEAALAGPLLGYDENGNPILAQGPPPEFFEPQAGYKYTYDEDTGMLLPPEGMEGDGGKAMRQYIEDVATGNFYRLNNPGLIRRIINRLRRKDPKDEGEPEEGEEGWDPDKGKFRGGLRNALMRVSAFFSLLGLFVQGLLGGFVLLNFFMTYFVYNGTSLREWLRYYAPLSLLNNRIYYTLITMSLVASAARLGRDQLRRYAPSSSGLRVADWLQLGLYIAAYITSVLCTPLDDELKYESGRNPRFWELSFSAGFKKRLNAWHGLNVIRTICAGLGWLLACYQNSPFVQEGVIRWEVNQRFARRTAKRTHASNLFVMADKPKNRQQQQQQAQGGPGAGGPGGGGGGGIGSKSVPPQPGSRAAAAGMTSTGAATGAGAGGKGAGMGAGSTRPRRRTTASTVTAAGGGPSWTSTVDGTTVGGGAHAGAAPATTTTTTVTAAGVGAPVVAPTAAAASQAQAGGQGAGPAPPPATVTAAQ